MKQLTLVFVTCFFSSSALLANTDTLGIERGLVGNKKVKNFRGSGSYYSKAKEKRGSYDVGLKITNLSKNKLHFYWDISFDGKTDIYSIIVEINHELITVYSPKDTESLDDFDTYKEAGWGYGRITGIGLKSKLLIFLNYNYVDGNKYDEHFVAQRTSDRKLTIDSSGTLGNGEDGMIEIWKDRVKSVD